MIGDGDIEQVAGGIEGHQSRFTVNSVSRYIPSLYQTARFYRGVLAPDYKMRSRVVQYGRLLLLPGSW